MSERPRYSTDLDVLRKEAQIEAFRTGGPGGQHRNKVESAIRLTHPPSGIVLVVSEGRSQHRNREIAFLRLQERLKARNRRARPRLPTKPSRGARLRRAEEKRRQARKKARRGRIAEFLE